MSKRNIEIDRLELRLKGISPEAARAAADGLGQDLLQRLASLPDAGAKKGVHRIGQIDSGAVKLSNGTSPGALRNAIAQNIAGSIQAKLSSREQLR